MTEPGRGPREAGSASGGPLPAVALSALFLVYLLTLAPDVTFWDAGEFIAAAHSLGIPHPPGTPLFVLLENVWARLFFFLPYAVATNLLSAAATLFAAALTARLVSRATGSGAMAAAAAIAAGSMSSVWLNATETEVYAASLALGILTIWAGERAGRTGDRRWIVLVAYLIALSVPLHLSALVAAPVAIFLAGFSHERVRWPVVIGLAGVFIMTLGVGRMSLVPCAIGAAALIAAFAVERSADGRWRARPPLPAFPLLLVTTLGVSAIAFLYLRAAFDPGINQGDPETWAALRDVVARRQYAVSPMWPREAPVWIQLANFGQYADWQTALSFGPTVLPSIARTLGTVAFLLLGYQGGVTLWQRDRRAALGVLALLLCGSLGVLVYLNLHAGPSIGYGLLPAKVVREARERDYFFVFAFWAWGTLAGVGAVAFAAWLRRPAWTGVLIAALPVVLNWRAVTRRGEPEQSLPRVVAEAFLENAPRNAVLFVMGDNDSYPLWYAQQVLGMRRDVAVVTVPLLPTEWYRSELSRRHFLLTEAEIVRFEGKLRTASKIAAGARRLGRPVAAAITMTAKERAELGGQWSAAGLTYVEGDAPVDTSSIREMADWIARHLPAGRARPAIDPVNDYFRRLLDCPRAFTEFAQSRDSTRLDSACNYR